MPRPFIAARIGASFGEEMPGFGPFAGGPLTREERLERREAFQELKALAGAPDRLEPEDLDASEDHFVTESEDGDAVLNGPNGTFETQIPFEEADSFADIAAYREAAIEELMSLTGDPEALEATDFDASDDFFITESEDGNVVFNFIDRSRETRIEFSEDTDTFEELADQLPTRGFMIDAGDALIF